jgi:ribokinase
MSTILTVGSLNMDQVVQVEHLPVMGETLLSAGSLRLVPGGKGANQAVAMARMGARVSMAGRVGRDPFGSSLLQALQADNVDTSLIETDEQAASGVALIFLTTSGENAIVVAPGTNMCVGEDASHMGRIVAALSDAEALVLQMEIPLVTVEKLVAGAHAANVPVVLNLAPACALTLETLRHATALVINETEASLLSALLGGSLASPQPVQTLQEARSLAEGLQGQGIANVVITLGAQGAILAYADETGHTAWIHAPAPTVQVVDTTAAGDCFVGAFTVALIERQPISQAARFAVHASALKVTKFGAQSGLPTRGEVEAFLHSMP